MNDVSVIISAILNFSLIALSFEDDSDDVLDFPDFSQNCAFDKLELFNFDADYYF